MVLSQQINLLLNLFVTRGLGFISAIRQYRRASIPPTSPSDQAQSDVKKSPEPIAMQSSQGKVFVLRLHASTDLGLPKVPKNGEIRAETWSTPLETVRLSPRFITLVGAEVCMNIGPRFDGSGLADILITTFHRNNYLYFGLPQNFTPVGDKSFADVWALITGEGLTSSKCPHSLDQSPPQNYEQWG